MAFKNNQIKQSNKFVLYVSVVYEVMSILDSYEYQAIMYKTH